MGVGVGTDDAWGGSGDDDLFLSDLDIDSIFEEDDPGMDQLNLGTGSSN